MSFPGKQNLSIKPEEGKILMKYQSNNLLIDFINIFLKFLASFALLSTGILPFLDDTHAVYYIFFLLPAPFISYLAIRYIKHIWSFLAIHLILIAIYGSTGLNVYVTVVSVIYLIFLTAVSFYKKLHPEKEAKGKTSLFYLSPFVILYLLSQYLGIHLNYLLLFFVILFILLYFINMYLINFKNYFAKHINLSYVPIKRMKSIHRILILLFIGLCLIIMLSFTALPLKEFLLAVGSLFLSLLRFLISLIPDKEGKTQTEKMETKTSTDFFPMMDQGKSSAIIEIIQNIILGAITLALTAGLILLLIYAIYRIYKLFYANKTVRFADHTEFVSPFDKREKLKKETGKKSGNRSFPFFSRSNNEKIRKLFFHAVKTKNKGNNIRETLTPIQLSEYALTGQIGMDWDASMKEKITALTAYYELARYSNYKCTKEDVLQVKNILRNHSA